MNFSNTIKPSNLAIFNFTNFIPNCHLLSVYFLMDNLQRMWYNDKVNMFKSSVGFVRRKFQVFRKK